MCLFIGLYCLQEVVIGLTEHSRLYMNDKEIANNCSSYFIHDEYLLLTTTSHTLRCFSVLPDGKGKTLVLSFCRIFTRKTVEL